jgi:flagellar biosynthetic protein FlhB
MADQSGKTEQPTQRRVEKARREGNFPAAREFIAALQFLAFLGLLKTGAAAWFAGFCATTRGIFNLAFAPELTWRSLSAIAWQIAWRHMLPLAVAGMVLATLTLGLRLLTTRFGFSLKKLAPQLSRLNPAAKLKELPRQNLPALLQAVVLLPLFSWAVYAIARDKLDGLMALPRSTASAGALFLVSSLMDLAWKAAGLFLVFGSVDLFRQLRRYRQDLRMSKQEIREEMKDVEGNPQMKSRIRRLQRDRARRQMMKEVPNATPSW